MHTGREVPPSGLKPNSRSSQTALRAVGPLSPPALAPPVKAPGRRGAKRLVGEFFIGEY